MRIENNEHEYQTTPHSVYACEYHVIWCTKYRRGVLSPEVQDRLKELIYEAQGEYGYIVRAVETMPDHVLMLVSIPPTESVSYHCGQNLKGTPHGFCDQSLPF